MIEPMKPRFLVFVSGISDGHKIHPSIKLFSFAYPSLSGILFVYKIALGTSADCG